MQLSDIQTLVLDILDDTQGAYFTQPVLNMRINLALRELQKRLISANNEYYSTCVTTNTVISQNVYQLPSDFLQILRLEYVTQGTGTTADTQKIYAQTPNQRDLVGLTSGQPEFYFFRQNYFVLTPTPDAVYELHLEYSYYVSDMVNLTDTPDAPQQFHPYIAYLAARDCLVKDGRSLASIEAQLMQYETLLKQIAQQREADGARLVTITDPMNDAW